MAYDYMRTNKSAEGIDTEVGIHIRLNMGI